MVPQLMQYFFSTVEEGSTVDLLSILSPKSVVIISFALCGFANLGAMALIIGGLGGIAPSRRQDIAEMGLRAIVAATLANLLSAAIAGMLI